MKTSGKKKRSMNMAVFTAFAMAAVTGGYIPVKTETFNDGLKKGKYPFSEEELAELEAFKMPEEFKAKKARIKELKLKYKGQSKV